LRGHVRAVEILGFWRDWFVVSSLCDGVTGVPAGLALPVSALPPSHRSVCYVRTRLPRNTQHIYKPPPACPLNAPRVVGPAPLKRRPYSHLFNNQQGFGVILPRFVGREVCSLLNGHGAEPSACHAHDCPQQPCCERLRSQQPENQPPDLQAGRGGSECGDAPAERLGGRRAKRAGVALRGASLATEHCGGSEATDSEGRAPARAR
jgi:hypothetical protein